MFKSIDNGMISVILQPLSNILIAVEMRQYPELTKKACHTILYNSIDAENVEKTLR